MNTPLPRTLVALLPALLLAWVLTGCQPDKADGDRAPAPAASASQPGTGLSDQIGALSREFAQPLRGHTVAVLEFPDLRGRVTELGNLVSEQLTTELVRSFGGNGRVLERKQVVQVLEELNLRKADLTKSEVALAAQQLGADVVVVGSASPVGRDVEVNARAVDVQSGTLLTAGRFAVRGDDQLRELAGRQASLGTLAGGSGPGAAADGPTATVVDATVGPVAAKLNECRASGSEVTCAFTFTSATVDAGLRVDNYQSEARDDGGNAYRFSAFDFGSENGSEWHTLLVAREATPARLVLTGVPINMARLTRVAIPVDIEIGERRLNNQAFIFRNVPIARDPA